MFVSQQRHSVTSAAATVVGAALAAAVLVPLPAAAATGPVVVINEVYGGGGNSGATYTNDFIELYNAGDEALILDEYSVQYRSSGGTAAATGVTALSGTIEPGEYYLVAEAAGAGGTTALPTPDATGSIAMSGSSGTVWLAHSLTALNPGVGSIVGVADILDVVGYGSTNTFEAAAAPGLSNPTSASRTGGVDTDSNAADFVAGDPTPQSSSGTGTPTPTPTATATPSPSVTPTVIETPGVTLTPIADIQGTGDASPLVGSTVTTRGIVTAAYPTGGFNGFYIQTAGTGGAIDLATHTASDAVFVYGSAATAKVAIGDHVEVTAAVAEYSGTTELVASADGVTVLAESAPAVAPATVAWPTTEAGRETLEGMLVAPQGDFTVTDTYDTNYYATVGLAAGSQPLLTPTEVAQPGTAEYDAAVADNAARAVTLDDGASTNFNSSANKSIPLPYLSTADPVRVGAPVTFTAPVIVEYRYSLWSFQPTQQLTADNAPSVQPAAFGNTRTAGPADVGGDIQIAGFNVLNYFTTTGDDAVAAGASCTFYTDRAGEPVTVNSCSDPAVRGAADDEDLARQQAKIVAAINGLGAEIVSLEEIENSAIAGASRDEAVSILVDALNAALGEDVWAFAPSPASVPAGEDVIRTAFIYKKAAVETVGASVIDDDAAFANARYPLAQAFKAAGASDDDAFVAIVNHFKSKGSGSGEDADMGDGQGASNASRVAQATALVEFSDAMQAEVGTDEVFLIGDFNAYTQEDPMQVLYAAGYTDQGSKTGKYTYSYDSASGSLDHILTSPAAEAMVTGVDIWNINSGESIALEYSRYNYNATIFYDESPYRSSDHDPVVVGVDLPDVSTTVDLNLLNINDFHGRIDANTVKFAGTIEQLRAAYPDSTLFLSDGDNIGASLFASAFEGDQPTIDVLNALDLDVSAAGNHEFDKGYDDLTGRVADSADFDYLGANVYQKGTTTPALQEYALFDVQGVTVAVIGAITEETPSLVSPGGIADLDFGDPVEAVNRVAAQLTDGDPSNGEADVIVAEYHEGAAAGETEEATLEDELAAGAAFADIVENTSASVDAIFTGHTHKKYAWEAPVPGTDGTRPVLQTGSYGENIGQVVLSVDPASGDVVSYTLRNVARSTTADDALVAAYPRVAEVKTIVDGALARAAVIGGESVGSVDADITTAFAGGSYVDGVYVGGTRDNRAAQSTLGNLVADSLVDSLSDPDRGGAEIGLVNPGGLRNELYQAPDGVITYAEANAVLPFVNNLWTTTLTGAQFKAVLEEQWQPAGASRPYLALGLSSNVSYTYDAGAERGSHITGIWIDGEPYDPAAEYRIGSFSFLLTGGDNFSTLAEGADTRDSGLIDRDAWIDYITASSPLSPVFASRSAQVTGVPDSVPAGGTLEFQVSGLDLTSLGSPANTTLVASIGDTEFDPIAVSGGAATVSLTVPEGLEGPVEVVLTAPDSDTVVRVPVTVTAPVVLNLLNINDFHGRIDANTVKFAGTIEQLRAAYGEENTLFLSDGDNIGASLFASAMAGDQPTIDVLNALDMAASAVGNHEFDKGLDDLLGRVSDEADFPYLGANVYARGTTDPVLPEYTTFEVDGLTVAVIGAVTEETGSLVSPGGISTIEFGDPVEAVNRVAAQLTDGDPSNGEADVIVAEYHEGAVDSASATHTLDDELALGGAFADIVTNTSAAVDAIFTGHTHKTYAWDGPVPGVEGATRPIIQTGSYGANIGQVVLTLDPSTGEVVSYTAGNVARTTATDAELALAYPRVAEVKSIVDAALAEAAVVGDQPVGSVTADITTAFAGGSYVDGVYVGGARDNRMAQSTLGNLVADSLVDSLSDPDRGGAEIGLVNPGGLRNELYQAPDGVITYAEANAVLPFVNNLWTTTLTGAQFKAVLEEQWQPAGASRPYLQLGVSSNVSYTYDATAPAGERITGIWIDGAAYDPAAEYRVGSFSFLVEGGDNFATLAEGADTRDSGLIDRDAWIAYLQENPGLSPDFASRSAQVVGAPESVTAGDVLEFQVSGIDMTSLGSPLNTSLEVQLGDTAYAPITLVEGVATVSLTVPEASAGATEVVLTATETGTQIRIPVTVEAASVDPGTGGGGTGGGTGGGAEPTTPATPAPVGDLIPALQNLIQVISGDLVPGGTIVIHVGTQFSGQWVSVWLHSDPISLGWHQVDLAGNITVQLPDDVTGVHRLVVQDADGDVIGWQSVTIGELAATGGDAGTAGGLILFALLLVGAGAAVRLLGRRRAA